MPQLHAHVLRVFLVHFVLFHLFHFHLFLVPALYLVLHFVYLDRYIPDSPRSEKAESRVDRWESHVEWVVWGTRVVRFGMLVYLPVDTVATSLVFLMHRIWD